MVWNLNKDWIDELLAPGWKGAENTKTSPSKHLQSTVTGGHIFSLGNKVPALLFIQKDLQRPLFASVDKDSWVIFKLFPPKLASNNLIQIKPLLNLHHGQGKPTCPTETKTCEEALIVFHFVQIEAIMMPENAVASKKQRHQR